MNVAEAVAHPGIKLQYVRGNQHTEVSLFYRHLILKISINILVSNGIRALIICKVMKWINGFPVTTVNVAFPIPTSVCVMIIYVRLVKATLIEL